MKYGIVFEDCKDVTLINPQMDGMEIGIDITNTEKITIKGGRLNTLKGVVGSGVKNLSAEGLTHDDRAFRMRPTLIAVMVRRAVHGDV